MRLLIDFATGVYTGSILDDQSLVEALPGQGHCDQSVRAWIVIGAVRLLGWIVRSIDRANGSIV